jgi:hypothetical protein
MPYAIRIEKPNSCSILYYSNGFYSLKKMAKIAIAFTRSCNSILPQPTKIRLFASYKLSTSKLGLYSILFSIFKDHFLEVDCDEYYTILYQL